MGARRTWLLRMVAAGLLAGDIGLVLALHRFAAEPWDRDTWLLLAVLVAIANGPYLVVVAASALLLRQHSASLWLLAVAVPVVGAASLLLRWADYSTAAQAWEARMSGQHFMNCGPPGRLVALVLDYVGLGFATGLALLVVGCDVLVRWLTGKSHIKLD